MKKRSIVIIALIVLISALALTGCTRSDYGKIGDSVKENDTGLQEKQLVNEINKLEEDLNSTASEVDQLNKKVNTTKKDLDLLDNQTAENTDNSDKTASDEIVIGEENTSELQRIEVSETDLVKLNVNVADKDKDKVKLTFSAPLDKNGSWQTDYQDEGEYIVNVAADDGVNTVEKKILLVVDKKNVAPTIENLSEVIDAEEGDLIKLKFNVEDLNGDDVKLTFSSPFDEDGEWKTDHTSAGEYEVEVAATDGEKETKKNVRVNVKDVNVPPRIIISNEVIRVKEGEAVKIDYDIVDLDGDKVNVTISDPVGDDGLWETGYTDHGEYNVTIRADDGKDVTEKNVKVIVEDVNIPPEIIDIRLG